MKAGGTALQPVVKELGPVSGWSGFHGYVTWSDFYDWWSGAQDGAAGW